MSPSRKSQLNLPRRKSVTVELLLSSRPAMAQLLVQLQIPVLVSVAENADRGPRALAVLLLAPLGTTLAPWAMSRTRRHLKLFPASFWSTRLSRATVGWPIRLIVGTCAGRRRVTGALTVPLVPVRKQLLTALTWAPLTWTVLLALSALVAPR